VCQKVERSLRKNKENLLYSQPGEMHAISVRFDFYRRDMQDFD